jgi:hypothetical protein
MRCVCVYCGILYNVKEPLENDSETHGSCDECYRIEMHNLVIYKKRLRDAKDKNSYSAHPN